MAYIKSFKLNISLTHLKSLTTTTTKTTTKKKKKVLNDCSDLHYMDVP